VSSIAYEINNDIRFEVLSILHRQSKHPHHRLHVITVDMQNRGPCHLGDVCWES